MTSSRSSPACVSCLAGSDETLTRPALDRWLNGALSKGVPSPLVMKGRGVVGCYVCDPDVCSTGGEAGMSLGVCMHTRQDDDRQGNLTPQGEEGGEGYFRLPEPAYIA